VFADLQSSQAGKQTQIKIYQNREKIRKPHAIEHWRWAILWQYNKKNVETLHCSS
jgi:hypothetical protein